MPSVYSFSPGATNSIAATTSSGRVQITGTGSTLEIQNSGTTTVFLKLGDSTVTAATTDYPLLAGQAKLIARNPTDQTYLAAIMGTGTATIYVSAGDGS